MKILIAGTSALTLWDRGVGQRAREADVHGIQGFKVDPARLNALTLDQLELENPVHILVPGDQARPHSRRWQGHTWNKPLPPRSVFQIGDGIYLASPELVFAHMAPQLGFIDSSKLGIELCGRYSTLVQAGMGYLKRTPLTSVEDLESCIRYLYPGTHHGMHIRSVQLIANGVESPMECASRILLCLPYRYGCPGFAKPTMNHTLYLTEAERRLLRKGSLRCDAFWPDKKVALEYKGQDAHGGESSLRNDTARENILLARGIRVIPATYASLSTDEGFSCLCKALSDALGKRLRFPEGYMQRQHETRAIVLRGNTCSWLK